VSGFAYSIAFLRLFQMHYLPGHHNFRCEVRQFDSGEMSTCGEPHTKTQHAPQPCTEVAGDRLPAHDSVSRKGRTRVKLAKNEDLCHRRQRRARLPLSCCGFFYAGPTLFAAPLEGRGTGGTGRGRARRAPLKPFGCLFCCLVQLGFHASKKFFPGLTPRSRKCSRFSICMCHPRAGPILILLDCSKFNDWPPKAPAELFAIGEGNARI
jgi:hypothetical protein